MQLQRIEAAAFTCHSLKNNGGDLQIGAWAGNRGIGHGGGTEKLLLSDWTSANAVLLPSSSYERPSAYERGFFHFGNYVLP